MSGGNTRGCPSTGGARTPRKRALVLLLSLLALVSMSRVAHASYPGIDGLVAYADVVDAGTDAARSAIFIAKAGQLTHPSARSGPERESDVQPAWSPDGKLLAFVRRLGSGSNEIYVIRPDGGGLRRVFTSLSFQGTNARFQFRSIVDIRWRADGDSIRFTVYDGSIFSDEGQSFVIAGARTGADLAAGDEGISLKAWDEGPSGTVKRCSFLVAEPLCAGGSRLDLQYNGQALTIVGGFAWWPAKNRLKVVFRARVPGSAELAHFSATWDPTARTIPPKVDLLDRLEPDIVRCVDPLTNFVTTASRYVYGAIAPSPSGRFLTVVRTEQKPETNAQSCLFSQLSTLLVLRETGFSQGELATGPNIQGVSWQPDPANLSVKISDGHGHPLDGLKVELRDYGDPTRVVDGSMRRGLDGLYSFEVPFGVYLVRAYLEDAEGEERGLGKAFEVVHAQSGNEVAWMDFGIAVTPDSPTVSKEVEFKLEEPLRLNTVFGTDSLLQAHLDAMAGLYFQCRRFIEWARVNLVAAPIPTVVIQPFVTDDAGRSFGIFDADYLGSTIDRPATIRLGLELSRIESRDFVANEKPENIEWHELSHHLYSAFVRPKTCGIARNHGGFANSTTCDSMHEGFATFLAAAFNGDTSYAGIFDVEQNEKAWGIRWVSGFLSTEDNAVAALYWDLVDDRFDGDITQALDLDGTPVLAAYGDRVSISLRGLWDLLVETKPIFVVDVVEALAGKPSVGRSEVDIDGDGSFDAYEFEIPFLMHGFHPIIASQTSIANRPPFLFSLSDGRSPFAGGFSRIGQTNRLGFDFHGVRGDFVSPRFNLPTSPNASVAVAVVDASGTPLERADLEWTIEYPNETRLRRQPLVGGTRDPIPFDLPVHFQGAGYTATEIPPCDRARDYVVDVTLHGSVNGYASPDAPTFDNCAYLNAVVSATTPPALTLTLRFPEDSAPPVTTATPHSLFQKRLYGPILGDWALGEIASLGRAAVPATWTIELACTDPVVGGFAAGCSRIEYSLDSAPFATYGGEFDITGPGLHTLSVRSVDGAGNVESAQTHRYGIAPNLESSPPVTTANPVASVPAVGNVTIGTWSVTLTCGDTVLGAQESGCLRTEYSLDGAPFIDYSSPVPIADVGTHVLRYRSHDVSGNAEALRQLTLVVALGQPDSTPPYTQIQLDAQGPESIAARLTGGLTVMGGWIASRSTCVDPGVAGQIVSGCARTEYRLDGGSFQPLVPPIAITAPGVHTLEYQSFDVAGNEEEIQSDVLTVVAPSDLDRDGLLDFADNCDRAANLDQRDTDADCIGNRCDADFNQNGVVDSNDASLLKARLGQSGATYPDQDLDGDGAVGAGDTAILRSLFRLAPGPSRGVSYDLVRAWCEG